MCFLIGCGVDRFMLYLFWLRFCLGGVLVVYVVCLVGFLVVYGRM